MTQMTYGNGASLTQTFDNAYRMTSQTVPGVYERNYSLYDANGNMKTISDLIAANDDVFNYDNLNRIVNASGSYGVQAMGYDKNGNRLSFSGGAGPGTLGYEPTSNRLATLDATSVVLDVNGNTLNDGKHAYGFNSFNRLVSVDTTLASYHYNPLGQRTAKDVNGQSNTFVYSMQGQLIAEYIDGVVVSEYLYLNNQLLAVVAHEIITIDPTPAVETILDEEAGTTMTGTWTNQSSRKAYNGDYKRADGGTGSTYRWTLNVEAGEYDVYAQWPSSRKNSKNVPITIQHALGTNVVNVNQTTNGGSWVTLGKFTLSGTGADYIEFSDANGRTAVDAIRLVKAATSGSSTSEVNVYYIHNDHLGTPRTISDVNQTAVWKWDSDPFGATAANDDPDNDGTAFTFNLRFPGQYYDAETGLHYNYFRYYDPSTGRYITSDPIGLRGGLNTYGYVGGNPLNRTDPKGLWFLVDDLVTGPIDEIIVITGILALLSELENTNTDAKTEDKKCCKPCKLVDGTVVPVGTIAYRPLDNPTNPQHGIVGPHYNLYKANQNPNNCKCFWQPQGAVPPSQLPADAIPIQPFAN